MSIPDRTPATTPAATTTISRRRVTRAVGGAALLAGARPFASSAQAQDATPAATATSGGFSAEQQLRFIEIIQNGLQATTSPSALVGIWSGNRAWTFAAGISDLRTGVRPAIGDHWRIASNTKTFVAAVVLQLVDEGTLTLDDTLEPLIAGVPNGDRITIRQLLGMTAGIYDYVRADPVAIDYPLDPNVAFLPEDALAIIRASTPDYEPGDGLAYSNSNYVLLGFIVERVTGHPIEDEIRTRFLEPLGLTQTSFPRTSAMPDPFVHGYSDRTSSGGALIDASISNPDVGWAAGAMLSTLDDLHTWVTALTDGSLFSPETQKEHLAFATISEHPVAMGYGLGLLTIGGMIGHNGGIVGYSSWMVRDPESDTSIVMVSMRGGEKGGTADPIFYDLAHEFFPERIPTYAEIAAARSAAPGSATPVASPAP